ncbi:ATP-binding protein [Geobacter sulfurreducens]|uniref:sensor histidine kinase n=1 Tax=Geobacter sulfurreducens TaxID=35554 RepID=UPI000DBB0847|nr:ATP-binding protein [Geobacter sulfurreducens]BBA70996.1 Phytochrome-like protein cph1 [Geobacter sulfurreducens]
MTLPFLTIRIKLISIIGFFLVPMAVLSIYNHYEILKREIDDLKGRNFSAATHVAVEVDRLITETTGVLRVLSRHPTVVALEPAAMDRLFAELLPSYPMRLNILAADMAGNNVGSGVSSPTVHTLNYNDKEWYQRARRGAYIIGDLHVSKLFKRPAVMIAGPVMDDRSRQVGVVGIPIDLNAISKHLAASTNRLANNTDILVLDRKGGIMMDTRSPERIGRNITDTALKCPGEAITPGFTTVCRGSDGVERIISVAKVGNHGWHALVSMPLSEARSFALLVSRKALSAALIAGLIAMFPAVRLVRSILGSLQELVAAMGEVERGNLTYKLHFSARDELETIASSFNAMAQRLRASEETLTALNAELEERVLQRTADLEAMNRELESFSYSVSHDLRAPLRHLEGFSEALLEDYADHLDENGRHCLERINGASRRLSQMIDAMLELSRLSRSDLQRERIDLGVMARDILDELHGAEPERRVSVKISDAMEAEGDARLVRVVMENLVGNAWKYSRTRQEAAIEIGTRQDGATTIYYVRDNGVGFDMAYADRLFAPFQRLHREDEFEGTGVGLATVQRIVHRHGGRLWAEAAPDNGATFFFTLGTCS